MFISSKFIQQFCVAVLDIRDIDGTLEPFKRLLYNGGHSIWVFSHVALLDNILNHELCNVLQWQQRHRLENRYQFSHQDRLSLSSFFISHHFLNHDTRNIFGSF